MKTTFKIDDYYDIVVKAPECKGGYCLTRLTNKGRTLVKELRLDDESWWQLQSFHVGKSYRGLGYGAALMKDVITRSIGMRANIILQAQPYNSKLMSMERLVQFYKEQGFQLIDQPANSQWMYCRWTDVLS